MSLKQTTQAAPPSAEEVQALAGLDDIELAPGEAQQLQPVVADLIEAATVVERFEIEYPALRYGPRESGFKPKTDENPFNVFIARCRVSGAPTGALAGRTVGVKDNISVAGVATTNGSRMPAFTPAMDAVVVERMLDAGCVIVGKLNMDDFGASGTGETSAFGPPRNPIDPSRSAGGSSGGSGAAVRARIVDLALAVDQGGSGRIPAAFCGVVAAKATHGLVPSFGITHIDHTIDFVTPIGRTVHDAALLLGVIAGPDARDPQWVRGQIPTDNYIAAASVGVRGLSIAVIEESCNPAICAPAVLEGVRRATVALASAGAHVLRVSLPLWDSALTIFKPYIACLVANTLRSEGAGYGHLGFIDPAGVAAFGHARRTHSQLVAKQLKCWLIAERYLHRRDANATYARLHDLRLMLRQQVSTLLRSYDLLLTPTVPFTAPKLAAEATAFAKIAARTAKALCFNTAPLNLSGHPALSVPSGHDEDGLPSAVQIVGPHFGEFTAFRAAFELERALGPFVP